MKELEKFACLWGWPCIAVINVVAAIANGNWHNAFSTVCAVWFAWLYYDAKYTRT